MSEYINVFVVKPPERHVLTASRVVYSHRSMTKIHWLSLNNEGNICVQNDQEELILHPTDLQYFAKENKVCDIYVDNYFNRENIYFVSLLKDYSLFVVNYGVYFCKDEISYTFARHFRLNIVLQFITTAKLFIRDTYLSFYGNMKFGLRKSIYLKATVIFWNEFSRRNFKRDYPYASTEFASITEKKVARKGEKSIILMTPSILGGRRGKAGKAELGLWKTHVKLIRDRFPESEIHLSLHPLYEGRYETDFIDQGIVSKIYVGIPPEIVKEYDFLFTDSSTLFWVAESFCVPAYFLEGYQIPTKFFDPKLNKENLF